MRCCCNRDEWLSNLAQCSLNVKLSPQNPTGDYSAVLADLSKSFMKLAASCFPRQREMHAMFCSLTMTCCMSAGQANIQWQCSQVPKDSSQKTTRGFWGRTGDRSAVPTAQKWWSHVMSTCSLVPSTMITAAWATHCC